MRVPWFRGRDAPDAPRVQPWRDAQARGSLDMMLLTTEQPDALELMAPKLKAAGVELHYTRPEAELEVMGGRVRLQQVLVNLLSNALDAMERLDAPQIEITVLTEGSRRRVEVRDRGPGLTEETLAHLFDPFFTTKSPGKGLGLGLSISYNIVRDFGGTLAARNHPEGGAVFSVDLAASDARTSSEAVAAQ